MGAVFAKLDGDKRDSLESHAPGSALSKFDRAGSLITKSCETAINLFKHRRQGSDQSPRTDAKTTILAKLNRKAAKKIYMPLQKGQIRLVHLHPRRHPSTGQPDNEQNPEVVCTLSHASLNDVPKYQALSYVWGEQNVSKQISLNGNSFYVTRNLFDILERLRMRHEKRCLWVDALSINQSDIPERNSQVQIMRSIYSRSQETLIWLHQQLQFNAGLWMCLLQNDAVTLRPFDINHMLSSFTQQVYWFRVWTAQEIRYSNQVTLITRFGRAPFDILLRLQEAALVKLDRPKSQATTEDAEMEAYLYQFQKICLATQPRQLRNEDHLDFDAWVDLCSLKDCLDPRDLVFGLWVCFPPEVQREIKVDYSLPPERILSTCKRAFLQTTPQLEFLARSNFASETATRILPSWDPELYFNGTWKKAWWFIKTLETYHLEHPQPLVPNKFYFRELSADAKTLHVRGRWLGSVDSAVKRFPTENAYGSYLLAYFVECMEKLNVEEDEIEEFALALYGQRGGIDRCHDLVGALTYLTKLDVTQEELGDKIKTLASGISSLDHTKKFVSRVSTVVRLQLDGATLFGTTWIKEAEQGDKVCLVEGCSQPLILRAVESKGLSAGEKFKLVGAIALGKHHLVDKIYTDASSSDIYLI